MLLLIMIIVVYCFHESHMVEAGSRPCHMPAASIKKLCGTPTQLVHRLPARDATGPVLGPGGCDATLCTRVGLRPRLPCPLGLRAPSYRSCFDPMKILDYPLHKQACWIRLLLPCLLALSDRRCF